LFYFKIINLYFCLFLYLDIQALDSSYLERDHDVKIIRDKSDSDDESVSSGFDDGYQVGSIDFIHSLI
jgi:hypothetical protein